MTRYPIYKVHENGDHHHVAFVSSLTELKGYLTRSYPSVMWQTESPDTYSSKLSDPTFVDETAEIFGENADGDKFHFLVKEIK